MKPERPSLLTHSSSDGNVDWDRYRSDMLAYLEHSDDEWEDWPEEDTE